MMSAAHRVEDGSSTGLSDDHRYMAVRCKGGGMVIYDARAGRTAQKVAASASVPAAEDQGLAQAEVAMALAPFIVRPVEETLDSSMSPSDRNSSIQEVLKDLVTAGLSYALFADSRGKVRLAEGQLTTDYSPDLRPTALSGPRIRRVADGNQTFQEVVVPVRIRGAVQAMLLLGIPGQ